MRGVLRIGGFLDVRHVPRQSGGCCSMWGLSMPGFRGRHRLRDGHGGTAAGDSARRRLGTAVSRLVMNCIATGRVTPPQQHDAARSAAHLPGAPKAPRGGVQPTTFLAPRSGARARRRRPAAMPCTYGAQASSLARSVPRCEASGLVTTPRPETGYRRNLLVYNVDFGFRLTLNGQRGQVPSGARLLPGHFFAGMSTSIRCAPPTGEALDWGAALRAGGTVVFGVS